MNKVFITGRITNDLKLETTQSGIKYVRFCVASRSNRKDAVGEYITDFFNCVAWKGSAESISTYCGKGDCINIVGNIAVSQYEQDGKKLTRYEIAVDDFEFGAKKEQKENPTKNMEQVPDSELPF